MMNLWEVLKASKTGIAPDLYARLLSDKLILAGKIAELADVPPLYFKSDGKSLIDYTIYGNTVQNGTPAPDNPIMPEGTGYLETVGAKAGQYKIPISSASTTTPVYLGEVETTRKIRKYEFTGTENFQNISSDASIFGVYGMFNSNKYIPRSGAYSSHYNYKPSQSDLVNVMQNNDFVMFKQSESLYNIAFKDTGYSDRTDFKSYLAAQYANKTPVTVWYVLATEETAVVNEPLMKIGDYADTLSAEQAGVEIPTIRGDNVLDVNTAVKPFKVRIKYHAP